MPPPTPSREGPIAVPLETTALPPVPLAVSGEHPALTPRASRKAAGNPLISVAAFAIMIAGAAIPLSRYLGVFEPPAAPETKLSVKPARVRESEVKIPSTSNGPEAAAPQAKPVAEAPVVSLVEKARAERLAELERSLPEDPAEQTEVLLAAADKSVEAGDLVLAETFLGRALKLGDQNPHVTFALARLRLLQGNLEGAEGWAAKAVRLRPRRAEYLVFYGELLRRLGREDEASRALRKARELER